jgi:hypothetical protein
MGGIASLVGSEVDGNDYIIGTIDFREIALLRQQITSDNANKVVCLRLQ